MKGKIVITMGFLFMLALCCSVPTLSDDGFYVIGVRPKSNGSGIGNVLKYKLFSSNTDTDYTKGPMNTWTKLTTSPTWTYTKKSDTSRLFITYQDTIGVLGGAYYVGYQVRVNDIPSNAGPYAATIVSNGGIHSSSVTGVWSDIPSSDVVISIWNWWQGESNSSFFRSGFPSNTTIIVMEAEVTE